MRAFWIALSSEGRWLLSTIAVQTIGRGLTLPFTLIYLDEVRGFGLGLSGTLMGLIALAALALTGPAGAWIDRVGARAVLLGGCASMIVGDVLLAFATTPPVAGVGLVLIGVNFGVALPAFNTLIASTVEGELRQQYFGVNLALGNLGISIGGVVGGAYVDVAQPGTFTTVFLADAACAAVPAALLLGPLRRLHGRAERGEESEVGEPASYPMILRRPAVLWLTALTFVATFVGYGQLEAGFPAFGRRVAEVSTQAIGVAFALNAVVIVLAQFPVLSRIKGRRRSRAVVVMAAVWAVAWALVAMAGATPWTEWATLGLLAFMAVFALGETLLHPTIPAISNDLASDRTRGRYNAINAAALQAGFIAGPPFAGVLLGHGLAAVYVASMLGCCVGIGVMALVLERLLPTAVNGEAVPVPPTVP